MASKHERYCFGVVSHELCFKMVKHSKDESIDMKDSTFQKSIGNVKKKLMTVGFLTIRKSPATETAS